MVDVIQGLADDGLWAHFIQETIYILLPVVYVVVKSILERG